MTIPPWVVDLESFTQWVDSPEFPSHAADLVLRRDRLDGPEPGTAFTHNVAKLWIGMALTSDRARLATWAPSSPTGCACGMPTRAYQPNRMDCSSPRTRPRPDGSGFARARTSSRSRGRRTWSWRSSATPRSQKDREALRDAYYKAGVDRVLDRGRATGDQPSH